MDFTLSRSKRSSKIKLIIHVDGQLTVMAPLRMPERLIREHIHKHVMWIDSARERMRIRKSRMVMLPAYSYAQHAVEARIFIQKRLEYFNSTYKLRWKKICVRNQKKRWGSCSEAGVLNFNYRVLFLPKNLADFVIVHELCHLAYLNHSKEFWNYVARTLPDYRDRRAELRRVAWDTSSKG